MDNSGIQELVTTGLTLDLEHEAARISDFIRKLLRAQLHRRGLVVAVSGGIDSSVCLALAVRTLGPKKVFALLLPETDSSSESVTLGRQVVDFFDVSYEIKNIASTLEAIGCYEQRDTAIREIFPEYDSSWKNKIVISGGTAGAINHFYLVVQKPGGAQLKERLALKQYLKIVAATNFKQRIRKNLEYFHADRLNYAVIGTPNRLEYDQGFFVKNGDGAADIKPIAHLYKTQVYAMARHLGLPDNICSTTPTTDTYSLEQGQDEFYFALPYQQMDAALWCYNHQIPATALASYLNTSEEQAKAIYHDIESKRKTTSYLHMPPCVIEEIF
ncbi:MAG TPA: NAD(+) synthase [Chromatiaceae bacterium]|nr:NAD(+) synthase [Chromatiaceae bacterium]